MRMDREASESEPTCELASLFAAGYLRLLVARKTLQDGKNPLDSLDQPSDELAMTTSRRSHRA